MRQLCPVTSFHKAELFSHGGCTCSELLDVVMPDVCFLLVSLRSSRWLMDC